MKMLCKVFVVFLAIISVATAEPFKEITIAIPVSSLNQAEQWYTNFLGADTEMIKPTPDIIEFKAARGVWLQLYETNNQQSSGAIIRFLVKDMKVAQAARARVGINTGEAIEIPNVVTYSEFTDPFGNAIGFYDLP
ncbi:MAG: VOC family protein [Alphaproteobacteria bacterium]|nr:VOC family protein [Alphaproteobacteria bacterium]